MTPSPGEIRQHYNGIENVPGLHYNPTGWNSENPNFEEAIKAVRPAVIIEVGVYVGASIITTLNAAKKHGLAPIVYAVDTFHGEALKPIGHIPAWPTVPTWNRPTQMQQFLKNIHAAGFSGQVVPVQEFTAWGARILTAWGVKAQMLYIDGDHSEEGAGRDMRDYWPLLEVGGRAVGDDLGYGGVWRSVGRFAQEIGHDVRAESGQWVIDKKS
jgi:hypothetical protein